jgi:hypothetical protein
MTCKSDDGMTLQNNREVAAWAGKLAHHGPRQHRLGQQHVIFSTHLAAFDSIIASAPSPSSVAPLPSDFRSTMLPVRLAGCINVDLERAGRFIGIARRHDRGHRAAGRCPGRDRS